MTVWLERREKIQWHAAVIDWRQHGNQQSPIARTPIGPPRARTQHIKMARNPSVKAVHFPEIAAKYGAILFQDALGDFIACVNNPGASGIMLGRHSVDTLIPFRSIHVYHNIKFANAEESEILDAIHAQLEQKDSHGRIIPSRFDTVLVHQDQGRKGTPRFH